MVRAGEVDPNGAASRLRRLNGRLWARRKVPWLLAAPAALLLFAVHYLAVAAGAWYAFTDWAGDTATPSFVGLKNFRAIFSDRAGYGALEHTILLAVVFVVVVNSIGLALGLALRRGVKARNPLRALFFAPVVMSPLAVSYIWSFILNYDGPLNDGLKAVGFTSIIESWLGSPSLALWSIAAVMVWQFSGLAMVFYLAGLEAIPSELEEASTVDGAGGLRRLRHITLPLLAPAATVSFTFTLILGLRAFDQIVALTGGGPLDASETLATQVWKQTWVFGRFGYGAALSLVLTLVIVVFALAQLAILRAREARLEA